VAREAPSGDPIDSVIPGDRAVAPEPDLLLGEGALSERAIEILEHAQNGTKRRRRGWLVRRALVAADLFGLTVAFLIAMLAFEARTDRVDAGSEFLVFLGALPVWIVAARLFGLYDHDDERTDHSTVDEFAGVLNVVTFGAWTVFAFTWLTDVADPNPPRLLTFWGLAIALVTAGRASARALCRRSLSYLQNTVIVGAGDIGQLVARKVVQHPEYGINLVGFLDGRPKERRVELEHVALLGPPDRLPEIVRHFDVERVIVAFSGESHEQSLALIRSLRDLDVQIDVVPRLFELVGPRVGIHTVEGLPLVGLPPAKLSRSSRLIKRSIDVAGSSLGLFLTAPLFALIAWRIKRDSPGPVFFRQTRLGEGMREFTALKFRTMKVDSDDAPHRSYIQTTMSASAAPGSNGLYKLQREDAVTKVGRWLRKTSLDELPQLINVLRGDMSLVGPRPCIPYETEQFAPHHFERFLVPAGLTGLWQVTARARSTFGEALDMDVAYAHGWSLSLDLRLLLRTPLQLFRQAGAA
jgi:exopolysaccharide biosynthesis polyprenyl glycosylphosphotransferase